MGGAFDPHRPPEQALVDACVHCGFCLPTCPTYAVWGEEMDSPRGRIVLIDEGLRAGSEMSGAMVLHLDRCLGCMACVTACPSGVRYDRLIEAARPQVERNAGRPARERIRRHALLALFSRPGRLRAAVPLLVAARRLGLGRVARGAGLVGRSSALAAMERLAPKVPLSAAVSTLPALTRARGTRRGTVGLLQGCIQRVFFGRVNRATVRVLSAEGFDVVSPRLPGCCGALPLHAGDEPRATELAKKTIRAFDGCEVVAVNAAGCGSAMKRYGTLLSDDPAWAGRAEAFSSRVRDISEILAGIEPAARRRPVRLKLAYHDACHLAHAQGIREAPRDLLRQIPGIELVEPAEWEICCGSAGLYNILQPEAAAELGRRKAGNLLATGADAVASGNPGCAMQIAAHLAEAGAPLPMYHPIELVAESIGAG